MLLDNQFNYVSGNGQSGAKPIGSPDVITPLANALKLKKSGYLYIWVSNETKGWDVFFDNLSVITYSGPLLEENHYYPFGLTMAGISDKALKTQYTENKNKSNDGSELQNKEFSDGSGLEAYDATFRMYDPQIGRFWQQDPMADISEGWSPYTFVNDNPISFCDPLGLDTTNLPAVIVTPLPVHKPQNNAPDLALIGTPPGGVDVPSAPTSTPEITIENPGEEIPGQGEPEGVPEPKLAPIGGPGLLGTAALTVTATVWPKGGPSFPNNDEGYFINKHTLFPFGVQHPFAPDPFIGHGNRVDNSDPHIVYEFSFTPKDRFTPILKYGISDVFRNGFDRPERQFPALRAIYGSTVQLKILTRTVNRESALGIEQHLVDKHVLQWKDMPREQIRPTSSY
jgi:RHS repeat-associated protein